MTDENIPARGGREQAAAASLGAPHPFARTAPFGGGTGSGTGGAGNPARREPIGPAASTVERHPDYGPEQAVGRRAERRAERQVALCFLASTAAALAFTIVFFVFPADFDNPAAPYYTPLLGLLLAVALGGVGVGAVLWAKKLMPDEQAVQERHPLASVPEEREAAVAAFLKGTEETGIARRSLIKRTLGLSVGALGLTAVVPILGFGRYQHKERALSTTPYRKGIRLVDQNNRPIRLGDLKIGGVLTVFPENHHTGGSAADAATLLIRLRPGENRPLPGRENWAVEDHVAYSQICTHAGCPVRLYEQQTHHLLCPCHQSTFQVLDGAKRIFGPAARALPQLPISVDGDGYFVAQSDYKEPVGPSFWERS